MTDPYSLLAPWYAQHARDLPWRRPNFPAWGTLVSEIMLQQTQASRVAVEIDRWLTRWPTPAALASAPTADVLRAWGNLGYPRRALRLQQAARKVVERHGGKVPDDLDALLALPGVGDYTARAVAVFHYRQRHPVVDTNVRRVVARYVHGLANQAGAKRSDLTDVERLLPADPDEAGLVDAALMELGALVCTSKSPACDECPLQLRCAWVRAGKPDNAPAGRPRQAKFEGSDRQARGKVLGALRAADGPLAETDVEALWPDAVQRERAVASLVADGLVEATPEGLSLPR